jgi:hypothetical protein
MVVESLFSGHKWVNTMHIFVGPILSLIAYLAYALHYQDKFKKYEDAIKGLLISQIITGFVVAGYHGHRLAKNNNLY